MQKVDLSQPGSICSECAERYGGEWPKGHVATHWMGQCSICEEEMACCCITDWNFPKVKLPPDAREI